MMRQIVCFECGEVTTIEVKESGTHEHEVLCCPLCGSPDIDDNDDQ